MGEQPSEIRDVDPAVVGVRFWAGARAAAGTEHATVAGAPTVAAALARLGDGNPDLARVLAVSTVLRGGVRLEPGSALSAGDELEVLPPFAGG